MRDDLGARLCLYVDQFAVLQADEKLEQVAVAIAQAPERQGIQQLIAQDAALDRRGRRQPLSDFDLLRGQLRGLQPLRS